LQVLINKVHQSIFSTSRGGGPIFSKIVLEVVADAELKRWFCDVLSALYGIRRIVVQVWGRRKVLGGCVHGDLHPVEGKLHFEDLFGICNLSRICVERTATGVREVCQRAIHPRRSDCHPDKCGSLKHEIKRTVQVQDEKHHWGQLRDGGQEEPNQTLLPEELPKAGHGAVSAQAKKANKHCEE
jgi:hypothetical protein